MSELPWLTKADIVGMILSMVIVVAAGIWYLWTWWKAR